MVAENQQSIKQEGEKVNAVPPKMETPTTKPDVEYQSFRVEKDGLPTGLTVKAETKSDAERQLAIGATRLGFKLDEITLI